MPSAPGQNWKLMLSYDGTDFHGWQVQPGHSTIQGELARAVERVTGERVLPQGSGRTDAGVHALGQVASFAMTAPVPPENLLRALNRVLPPAVRVLSAEHVAPGFHARHSARGKTYEYRVFRGEICPPWLTRYVYALQGGLHFEAMQQAAASICGEHDFTSFAASDPELKVRTSDSGAQASNVRTINQSEWLLSGDLLIYRVRGSGFLHHMVRNLVGTFLDVGRGHIPAEDIPAILNARSRSAAGPTAPARGLFLVSVDYQP